MVCRETLQPVWSVRHETRPAHPLLHTARLGLRACMEEQIYQAVWCQVFAQEFCKSGSKASAGQKADLAALVAVQE